MKNKLTTMLLAFFLLFNASFVLAQDSTKSLNMQEAIELGIKNSKQLKISRSRIDAATAHLQEASDYRLPDFSISGSYLRLNNADVNLKIKSGNTSGNSGAASPSVNQALYGIANISLPIYAGGRIRYGIESAKLLKQAAMLDADNDKDAVAFNAVKAYINLYKSFEAVTLVKENLQSSMSRDTNFSNLEKNGLLARNDLLKSQLQTSNIELALLDAEKNNKLAMINMNLLLGLPENTILILDTGFINTAQPLKSFPEYESDALKQRKDIQAIGYRKKATATAIQSAKAEAYPTLALTGGYVAADVPKLLTITNALNIGIGVKYNLASLYKKNTKLAEAKAKQAEVTAGEEILNDQVRSAINQDYQDYLVSLKKTEVFEKALEQAKENYRITKNKYDNNLVTLTELLDADVALLQSKLNIRFSKADAILAYNKLLQTSGALTK
ncbi:MAG: TolC family protein [Bacteroidetes bacterium]|nr:TolC family protein [Bacteroidota bacterium]